ncbi:MAG: hypothetical protein CXR30_02950 [Geobacter sp.]|nr:MAG: hypothetical protein CXR30_02950 [Geobacter sp.]
MGKPLFQQAREAIGKQYARDHAQSTTKATMGAVRQFCAFLTTSYGLAKIETLKKHMVDAYVKSRAGEVGASALERDATAIRMIADAINKANIVPHSNAQLGIVRAAADRYKPVRQNQEKAAAIKAGLYARADATGAARDKALVGANELQAQFGLRAKESIMSRAVERDGRLVLEVGGAKGGRPRTLEPENTNQRVALELLRTTSREIGNVNGKLIPPDMSAKQMYDYQRNTIRSLGATKAADAHMHANRHKYAQDCRKAGNSDKEIALKLGHGREQVVPHYVA